MTLTPLGSCGLAVGGQQVRDRGHVVLGAADVDLAGLGQHLEQPLGDRQRDEHDRVQRGVELDRVEDPDDDEPGVADVDHHVAADLGDLQRRGGLEPEHDLRVAAADGGQEVPGGERLCRRPAGGCRWRRRRRFRRSARPARTACGTRWRSSAGRSARRSRRCSMCLIIGTELGASTALLPRKSVPGETVSRFVPSASISAIRFACAEEETPTTATIAPMPIAIPSAESAARSLRVRRPCSATPNSSRGGSRARPTSSASRRVEDRPFGCPAVPSSATSVMRARPRRSRRRACAGAGGSRRRCARRA